MGPLPSANQSSPAAKTDTATESKSETTDGKPKTFRFNQFKVTVIPNLITANLKGSEVTEFFSIYHCI